MWSAAEAFRRASRTISMRARAGQQSRPGPGWWSTALASLSGPRWRKAYTSSSLTLASSENLCAQARFTGYQIDGGFAGLATVDERYCFQIAGHYSDVEAAPLLCAGLIGYRALRMAGEARRLGLYGFGAAAHIVAQVAKWQGREVFAFARPGDDKARRFALELGSAWAGSSDVLPPEPLDAAIIFAPVGALVPVALR